MKYIAIAIALILITSSGIAKEPLTLSAAIQKGLENNYQIRISKKNLEIAENNDSWGAAGRFPTLDFGLNQGNRYDDNNSYLPGGVRVVAVTNSAAPYVNLRWLLFDGFSISINKNNLEKLRALSKGDQIIALENTIKSIIQSYYYALLEKEKLSVMKEVMYLSKDRYDHILLKKELGSSITFEVLQEKNAFLKDSSNYILQEINYKNALRNLNYLLGEKADTEYDPSDKFQAEPGDYKLSDLMEKMHKNNSALRNQYLGQQMRDNKLQLAKNAWYPRLSLNSGADYSKSWIKPSGEAVTSLYSTDFYANLSLNVNLFNGGNTQRAIENAEMEKEVGLLQIDASLLDLDNRLANLFELYSLRKQLYNVATENKNSAKLNLQIAADKFESGAINSFNYRDIQLIYLAAATDELLAIFNLIETRAELMRITGGIISQY